VKFRITHTYYIEVPSVNPSQVEDVVDSLMDTFNDLQDVQEETSDGKFLYWPKENIDLVIKPEGK
jgi:hypothetical protein